MRHTFYAVFDTSSDAAAAIRGLEAIGTPRQHCNAVLHEGTLSAEELHLGETGARSGAATAGLGGGLIGALLGGVIAGPIGLIGAGAAVPALFGALVGTLYGGAVGGVASAGGPDARLEALLDELRAGKVLVTVEAPGMTAEELAEQVMLRHGGRVEHRALAYTQ
jgi:hypothetical protein